MPPPAPKPKRQLAMVFDLNKCLGCQTCTISCKTLWTDAPGMEYMWWNIVNTMPGEGTPRGRFRSGGGFADGNPQPGVIPKLDDFGEAWEFNYDEVFYGGMGEKVHLEPKTRSGKPPEWGPNWDEDQGAGVYPNSYFFYLPVICMHCTRPACLEACPRSVIYKREEDGIVLIDEERCHGYRFCMEACPYKRIYFNEMRFVAQKCIFCFPRIEEGVAPACARQCPGRLRHIGYLDDPESSVSKLVNDWKVAIRLRPDLGTEPNVFYVPPLAPPPFDDDGNIVEANERIPRAYLHELFGPDVDRALGVLDTEMANTRSGGKSELMDLLIAYDWHDLFGGFTQDPGKLKRPPKRG